MKAYVNSFLIVFIITSYSCEKNTTQGQTEDSNTASFSARINGINWPPFQRNFASVSIDSFIGPGIDRVQLTIGLTSTSSSGTIIEQISILGLKSPTEAIETGDEFYLYYPVGDSTHVAFGTYSVYGVGGITVKSETDSVAYFKVTNHNTDSKLISGEFWFEAINDSGQVYLVDQGVFKDLKYD